ncbi:extracellular solute-binding protein [Pararhizobium mangrovi]|uniref:ABC transporter substrate-binding protein n=1 Tax=Pararhizobium mangrovi TaxID=2590452 RepID=A0A506UE83_9HYPH|nr:extracellular solute-binding protein [Pararhizobium mangrovi]TPW31928.1 ABC transporter substrate-binding protein [Pararhizobium mangrovi]
MRLPRAVLAAVLLASLAGVARADEPVNAIAMHGKPALPADYRHLPYANPDAPEGGSITYGVVGSFDSLNPFILKSMRTTARGIWDPEFGNLVYESLMQRSMDEPFSLYGLLAETVQMDDARTYIRFNLNPKAHWSDGKPVTADDVVFSFRLLAKKGRPPYSNRLNDVAKITKVGARSVRFDLKKSAGRELPLILAMSPILPKHAIDPGTFGRTTLEKPVGSGPYKVGDVEPGRSIVYKRDPNYWGKDLPVKRGFDNFGTVTVDYFLSQNASFEAFKKGIFDVFPESDPIRWRRSFNFPAVRDGRVVKDAFRAETPSGMYGFVLNTRRPVFKDRRVRHALALALDFQWINRNLFGDAYARTQDYWQGSSLSCFGVPASAYEKKLLAPFPDAVTKPVMEGTYKLPVTDGSGRDRTVLREAYDLLTAAGYHIDDGRMVDRNGRPLAFEVMTQNAGQEKIALAYQRTLASLGIAMSVRTVDDTQYQQRTLTFDYDVIVKNYPSSLSPGSEQIGRWASSSANVEGSFNYAGTKSPAIDATIEAMLDARSQHDFRDAVRALDRVLISGYYVVPLYHVDQQWIARWGRIRHPDTTPLYGYQLETWWDARARN